LAKKKHVGGIKKHVGEKKKRLAKNKKWMAKKKNKKTSWRKKKLFANLLNLNCSAEFLQRLFFLIKKSRITLIK
jgi:hypothetical protein